MKRRSKRKGKGLLSKLGKLVIDKGPELLLMAKNEYLKSKKKKEGGRRKIRKVVLT